MIHVEDTSSFNRRIYILELAKMFVRSLRSFGGKHKDIPIYVGVVSVEKFSLKDLLFFNKENCKVDYIRDYDDIISSREQKGLMIGRHLVCHYYGKKLLKDYDELIYLDVDVFVSNEPNFPDKVPDGIMMDVVPSAYLEWEKFHVQHDIISDIIAEELGYRTYPSGYHAPWMTNITSSNLFIYDEVIKKMRKTKKLQQNNHCQWGIQILNWVLEENKHKIKIFSPTRYSGILPFNTHWDETSSILHYDSFDNSGWFYQVFILELPDQISLIKECIEDYNIVFDYRFKSQIKEIFDPRIRDWLSDRVEQNPPEWVLQLIDKVAEGKTPQIPVEKSFKESRRRRYGY